MRSFRVVVLMVLVVVVYSCSEGATQNEESEGVPAKEEKEVVEEEPKTTSGTGLLYSKTRLDYEHFWGDKPKNVDVNWRQQILEHIELYSMLYWSDSLKVQGFYSRPKEDGKFPVIIFCRGGNSDYAEINDLFAAAFGYMSTRGYVFIVTNYRGAAESDGQDEFGGKDVRDVEVLFDLIREWDFVDTSRVGIIASSRGSINGFQVLKKRPPGLRAFVSQSGVTDLFNSAQQRPRWERNVFAKLIPNYWDNREEELTKRSAIKWVDELPKDVPILIQHGEMDDRISVTQARDMQMAMQKYGVPHEVIIYEGSDHHMSGNMGSMFGDGYDWMDKYVRDTIYEPLNLDQ